MIFYLFHPISSRLSVPEMCFRTIHTYQCCGKQEIYIHYPCLSVRNKEHCSNLRGPSLCRTTSCSTCCPKSSPEVRFDTTLHRDDIDTFMHRTPEERRDMRRDRVAVLQVLAESVFAMSRGNSEHTVSGWANIFERIDRLRDAL